MKREDIRIRDPFVYADEKTGWYYMYGTTALEEGSISSKNSFSVYKSRDLENFDEGKKIFDGDEQPFWGTYDFWAAEMHEFGGKYYLFGSVKAEGRHRATHIFVCDTPDGKFTPVSTEPATPIDWDCLDGTLFVEDGTPYIVFCHEWSQCKDGEICAQALSEDLSKPVDEPFLLFKATDNASVKEIFGVGSGNFVTDGPFLWKENGKVKMTWSSYTSEGKYAVLGATADSLRGKWEHTPNLFDFDGGHGMFFNTFDGKRKFVMHKPNEPSKERANFFDIEKKF